MFKAWYVIILFILGGAVGLLGWLADFAPYYSFATSSKSAVAVAASKTQKPGDATSYLSEPRYQFPLRFKTDSGSEVVSSSYYKNTYVPRRVLEALERDGRVTVFYLPDDPQRVLFEGDVEKLPKGWGSLAWGIVSLVVGVLLIGRRYKLARYTKYLGHDDPSGDQ
jgi:hypothetical protein